MDRPRLKSAPEALSALPLGLARRRLPLVAAEDGRVLSYGQLAEWVAILAGRATGTRVYGSHSPPTEIC